MKGASFHPHCLYHPFAQITRSPVGKSCVRIQEVLHWFRQNSCHNLSICAAARVEESVTLNPPCFRAGAGRKADEAHCGVQFFSSIPQTPFTEQRVMGSRAEERVMYPNE